ncbi:MAG: DUF6125 family protein [Syntrophorhabdaceae bacterium]|nr:DUF6125 family protein [Syntrophorhabdaceae bacterium]
MTIPYNPVHAELEGLPRETLIELIKMYSLNWHTCDGLWFSGVEDRWGTEKALEIDIHMWDVSSRLEARRIKEVLAIPDNAGLDQVMRAINFMSWAAKCSYTIEKNDGIAVLTVTSCPPQEARIKSGKTVFACRPTFEHGFTNVAAVIDPGVKVSCTYCPPGPHPPDSWCRWEFASPKTAG